MKRAIASPIFAIALIAAALVIAGFLGSCATYRGLQDDVHSVTNPHLPERR